LDPQRIMLSQESRSRLELPSFQPPHRSCHHAVIGPIQNPDDTCTSARDISATGTYHQRSSKDPETRDSSLLPQPCCVCPFFKNSCNVVLSDDR
jgi:hypothetical protein